MNSREVRKSLEPFKNFAPAILYAAEIIESAEKAEGILAGFEKEKAKKESEISDLDVQLTGRRQELQKVTREVEALKPSSTRIRDLEARELAVASREASVLAREEKVLAREEKAKHLASTLAGFGSLDS
ncbi:MAG TPA: hypothetical protein VGA01_06920, partial [Candidatus Binatia bacterium]|nr:hypothetical protein [Verrucomicrobiae bacterium]